MKAALIIAGLLALMTTGCDRRMTWNEMHNHDTGDHKYPITITPVRHIHAPVETRDC